MKIRLILPLLALVLGLSRVNASEYSLNLSTDIPVTAMAIITSGFGTYLYSQMEVPKQVMNPNHLLPWDKKVAGRYSKGADQASDIGALLAITPLVIGGTALYSRQSDLREFGTFSLMLVQSVLFQSGINLAVRASQLWPRPYVYATSGEGFEKSQNAKGEAYGSFFSGHASAAFTVAVFTSEWFNETHPNSANTGVVRALAFSLAGIEGVLRIAAGKHYPTDVLVGALVGTSVSYGVLFMHKKRNEKYSFWAGPNTVGITFRL